MSGELPWKQLAAKFKLWVLGAWCREVGLQLTVARGALGSYPTKGPGSGYP